VKLRLLALPAALSVLALCASGASAHGGSGHGQIEDDHGDAVDLSNAHDILGASFTVTKTVTKTVKVVRGKRVTTTVSTPKNLVVHLELAAAPDQAPGTFYEVGAETACGTFTVSYYKSPVLGQSPGGSFSECGPENDLVPPFPIYTYSLSPDLKLGDDFIEWTIPFKSLPKEIKLGKVWDAPFAYVSPADPVFGIDSQTFTSIFGADTGYDVATGDGFRLV
jgi:hypothetical protein